MRLTPKEQKLYKALYASRIFNTKDVKKYIKKPQKAFFYTHKLLKKGYIKKIKKGLYAIVPYEVAPDTKNKYQPEPKLIATKLVRPYFLSHHSALELHGIASSVFFQVYISSFKQFKKLSYQGFTYIPVYTKHTFGITKTKYYGVDINVTDLERTFLDCIRQLKYAGGIEEFIKSIMSLSHLNYKKLMFYLKKFNEKSLYIKTGYFLGLLKEEMHVPKHIIEKLKKKVGKKKYYIEKKGKQKYVRGWNLIVPKNIKELMKVA